jgi:outer membrane protein assembly factor BamB
MLPQAAGRMGRMAALVVAAVLLAGCAGGALTAQSGFPGLASDGVSAYLAYGPAVYAVDLQSGALRWRYPAEPQRDLSFFATPVVGAGDQLIVGDFSNRLFAVDRRSGSLIWGPVALGDNGANKEHIIGGPALVGDVLLVPSSDGRLYARMASDGSALWTFPAESSPPLRQGLWAAPVVEDDRVFLASLDHHLYAVDLESGRPSWPEPVDLGGALADAPALAGDLLLVGSFSSQLVALGTGDGELAWSFPTQGWVWGNPAIADGLAYFGDLGGTLYAVSVEDGTPVWTLPLSGDVTATPAVADGKVYVVTDTGSLVVRQAADSNPAWQAALEGQLLTDPLVVEDQVLVASVGGSALLSSFDAASGAIRWTFAP